MFGRGSKKNAGASARHAFVKRTDDRNAIALGALNSDLSQVAPLALTGASLREYPCALPGCGKPQADPIHEL